MCLILAAWRAVEGVPLVVAANRDEFHARPAAPAQFWEDIPAILAGRDLQAMGTWMGVARNGRFAAVTNYRGAREPSAPHSRGALVTGFLTSTKPAGAYVSGLDKDEYSGLTCSPTTAPSCGGSQTATARRARSSPASTAWATCFSIRRKSSRRRRAFAKRSRLLRGREFVRDARRGAHRRSGVRHALLDRFDPERNFVRYAERAFAPDGEAGETPHFEFKRAP